MKVLREFESHPLRNHNNPSTAGLLFLFKKVCRRRFIAQGGSRMYADEDMFRALPKQAYSIHVGNDQTEATYAIGSQAEVLPFLDALTAE